MMVALQLPLWGKALCEYPAFLVNQSVGNVGVGASRVRGFEIITREILTIGNQKPIGFI